MSDKTLYTLIVHSENIAGLLNQITAVFTRRQINIESLNVSASSIKGVHKYTITAWTDKDTIEKVVKQIEKRSMYCKRIISRTMRFISMKLPYIKYPVRSFRPIRRLPGFTQVQCTYRRGKPGVCYCRKEWDE